MPIIPPIWRTRPTTPEQHLAAAILAQAFSDMFATDNRDKQAVDTIAVSAMRYLTDRYGLSAQWRNRWCDCLDLDGDMLATRVRMILDGQVDLPGESRLGIARDRWARIARTPAPSDKSQRLPTIKAAPPLPPTPPVTIDPSDIDLTVPDDPLYVSGSGHLRASRRWKDGETSRFVGPLPSLHTKTGQALWAITQTDRVGHNTISFLGHPDQVIADLRAALPNCDLCWTSQGKRLFDYQPNAGLRLYLKQLARAA